MSDLDDDSDMDELLANFYGDSTPPGTATTTATAGGHVSAPVDPLPPLQHEWTEAEMETREDFDAAAFAASQLRSSSAEELLQLTDRVAGKVRRLDSSLQTLVFENYAKFVDATDAVRRMGGQLDTLASKDLALLREKTESLTRRCDHVTQSLAPSQSRLAQLRRTCLLMRRLDALFELPKRMRECIKQGALLQATIYYTKTIDIVRKQAEHSTGFAEIDKESQEPLRQLRRRLRERVRNVGGGASLRERIQAARCLVALDAEQLEGTVHALLETQRDHVSTDGVTDGVTEGDRTADRTESDGDHTGIIELLESLQQSVLRPCAQFVSEFTSTFAHAETNQLKPLTASQQRECDGLLCAFVRDVTDACVLQPLRSAAHRHYRRCLTESDGDECVDISRVLRKLRAAVAGLAEQVPADSGLEDLCNASATSLSQLFCRAAFDHCGDTMCDSIDVVLAADDGIEQVCGAVGALPGVDLSVNDDDRPLLRASNALVVYWMQVLQECSTRVRAVTEQREFCVSRVPVLFDRLCDHVVRRCDSVASDGVATETVASDGVASDGGVAQSGGVTALLLLMHALRKIGSGGALALLSELTGRHVSSDNCSEYTRVSLEAARTVRRLCDALVATCRDKVLDAHVATSAGQQEADSVGTCDGFRAEPSAAARTSVETLRHLDALIGALMVRPADRSFVQFSMQRDSLNVEDDVDAASEHVDMLGDGAGDHDHLSEHVVPVGGSDGAKRLIGTVVRAVAVAIADSVLLLDDAGSEQSSLQQACFDAEFFLRRVPRYTPSAHVQAAREALRQRLERLRRLATAASISAQLGSAASSDTGDHLEREMTLGGLRAIVGGGVDALLDTAVRHCDAYDRADAASASARTD